MCNKKQTAVRTFIQSHFNFASSHSILHAFYSLGILQYHTHHNALPHKGSLPTAMGRASWTLGAVCVCVCVCTCVYVCVCQGDWEDALLSSASELLLSRVVQISLSYTHTDIHHTADSHAWNIVCIKYLMRCVRLSGVVRAAQWE